MADKVKVFASDDNLKILGELLSNDSSRKIMLQLMTEPMYINELAATLDLRVSLVVHHINKMKELGLVEYTLKKITKKGQKHKFLKISSDLFITVGKTQEEIKETGLLKRIFRDGIKFTVIGFCAITSWFSGFRSNIQEISLDPPYLQEGDLEVIPWSSIDEPANNFFLIPIIIIGCSLFLIWFSKKYK